MGFKASRLSFNTPKATLDLELVAPLMLSSFVARVVASMLVQHVRREFPRRCGVRMLITYCLSTKHVEAKVRARISLST